MQKPIIYNIEPDNFSNEARDIYGSFAEYLEYRAGDDLHQTLQAADAIIVRFGLRITPELIKATPKLKLIITATTGLNHIDRDVQNNTNLKIICLKGEREFLETITATADLTWALLLSLYRKIPNAIHQVHNSEWNRDLLLGKELRGKTLGIIGFGRLGSKVAQYGLCFGMRVMVFDKVEVDVPDDILFCNLDTLLQESDVVSLHIPGDPKNFSFFNMKKFSLMKAGAYLINTARGEIIDELALLTSLKSSHLGGAALDVIRGENLDDPDWIKNDKLVQYSREHSNLIITPHIGGATTCSLQRAENFVANKAKEFLMKI